MRLLVASDFHASERTWRKFLNAIRSNVYGIDAALVAGDLTGKALVPITSQEDGSWIADVLGASRRARTDDELVGLEREIADIGYYSARLSHEEQVALAEDPELLRERFRAEIQARLRAWLDLAAERLGDTGIPLYLMPGNDDDFHIDQVLAESPYAIDVNEKVIDLGRGYQLASMGWSSPTPWSTPRELPEDEFLDRAADLLREAKDPQRTVLMTHVPPHNSGLDTAPLLSPDLRPTLRAGEVMRGPVGSIGVRKAIEQFQPVLGAHGHIHESAGERRIGRTLCVNAGSESNQGIFRGYLIDLGNAGVERAIRVEG
jgi:uncharacterized protein